MDKKMMQPGDTLGIMGGGQLGRMLSAAAMRLGLNTAVFETAEDIEPNWLPTQLDALTYEFENLDVEALRKVSKSVPVRPSLRSLQISQDRLLEKEFLKSLGIPVADFITISGFDDALNAEFSYPAILKTVRQGYDGKGQVRIEHAGDLPDAWGSLGLNPAVLEQAIEFECECSVVAARGLDGEKRFYDIGQNEHSHGILRRTTVPAGPELPEPEMREMTTAVLDELDYVGVLAVEFFIVNGKPVVNEFAPRPHNSGHWTLDGCRTSQFENHVRAVAGWPLGSVERLCDIETENLLGDEIEKWKSVLAEPDSKLHLYGKKGVRPGRKMGHVNRIMK